MNILKHIMMMHVQFTYVKYNLYKHTSTLTLYMFMDCVIFFYVITYTFPYTKYGWNMGGQQSANRAGRSYSYQNVVRLLTNALHLCYCSVAQLPLLWILKGCKFNNGHFLWYNNKGNQFIIRLRNGFVIKCKKKV